MNSVLDDVYGEVVHLRKLLFQANETIKNLYKVNKKLSQEIQEWQKGYRELAEALNAEMEYEDTRI